MLKYYVLGPGAVFFVFHAYAGDVVKKDCRNSLMNLLYQIESKGNNKLDMIEFRHKIDTGKIFEPGSLKIVSVPMMKEIFGIYRRPLVAKGARSLFSDTKYIGEIANHEFTSLIKPNTFYTYVVDDEKIVFAQTRPGKMRDYGSKHAILRDQSRDLHLAGEFHLDDKGIFHFDGASGTFQPPNEVTKQGLVFFRDHMGIKNAEVHLFAPPVAPIAMPVKSAEPVRLRGPRAVTLVENAKGYNFSNETFEIRDEKGQPTQFKLQLAQTESSTEKIFDTRDLTLTKNKSELRSTEEINESSEAVKIARKHAGEKEIIPMAVEERITKTYTAEPQGKAGESYRIVVDEIKYKGIDGDMKDKERTRFVYRIEGSNEFIRTIKQKYNLEDLRNNSLALENLKAAN